MIETQLTPLLIDKLPENFERTFTELIEGFGWTPSAGPMVGYWERYPAGHKCLWSVGWSARGREIRPNDILPLEFLSLPALLLEAQDYLGRAHGELHDLANLLAQYKNALGFPVNVNGYDPLKSELAKLRNSNYCGSYLLPFSLPSRVFTASYRPGWPREINHEVQNVG